MRRFLHLQDRDLPAKWVHRLSWLLAVVGLSRGIDYWTDPGGTSSLVIVEGIAELDAWGICLVLASSLLAVGLAGRLHLAVFLGHVACAGIYVMLTIATAQAVIPTGNGYRGIGPLLTLTVLHVAFALLRGPIPKGTPR